MLLLEQFEHLTLHPKNAARLKELVLQLAVQGKLTENWRRQNPDVEPAVELLRRIKAEKAQLVKEKKIKKSNPADPVSDDEVSYTLPESWSWCRLDEIGIVNPRNQIEDDTRVSFIPMTFISEKYGIKPTFEERSWKELKSSFTHVAENDVAVAKITPCFENSKACIFNGLVNGYGAGTTELHVFRSINSDVLPGFIYILFKSPQFLEDGKYNMRGAAGQKRVPTEFVKNYLIPLPPLAEQEAIVARVEELMQKIEELEKQTAERIQLKQDLGAAALQQLTAATNEELEQNWLFLKQHFQAIFNEAGNVKKLRETILQLAVQGKLTATWRTQNPSTEPASELLKRIQAEKAQLVKDKKIKKEKPLEPISEDEVPYALPEGWVWCRLADIASKLGAGSTPKGGKDVYVEEGIPFLRSQNIYDDGLRLNGVAQITEAVHQKMSGTHVQPKDILLNITGGSIGRCALVADDFDTANVSQHVAIIRLIDLDIRKYIHYVMTSDMIQRLIMDVQVGVSREGLSMTKLREFLIPLPPLAEQEAIVAKVNQLMQLCNELEQQIQQSKQEAEALMQAVVQEALQVQEEVEL